MKVDMTLELKDVPGSLLRALEPISGYGGNIVSVLHSRSGRGPVEVHVGFTIKDQETLDLVKKELKKQSVRFSGISVEGKRYYSKKSLSLIMIGHIIDRDMQDSIDRINKLGLVSAADVSMPAPEEKSSVMFEIEVDNGKAEKLDGVIQRICEEKKFLLITSI